MDTYVYGLSRIPGVDKMCTQMQTEFEKKQCKIAKNWSIFPFFAAVDFDQFFFGNLCRDIL